MIIYDNNKQFVAIDEDDLKSLGYPSLQAMLSEANDFADLFIKTPGHVHNFKNLHWIDFVLCATDKNSSKAIIHANGKTFSCIIDIKTTYLTSSPSQISYNIHLNNLRLLTDEELQNISNELQTRPATVGASSSELEQSSVTTSIPESVEISPSQTPPKQTTEDTETIDDPYETEDELSLDVYEPDQDDLDKVGDAETSTDQISKDNLDEDYALDISLDEVEDTAQQALSTEQDQAIDKEEEDEYVFNIQDTADALEMDVATIKDFVNDFIIQAKDFKPKLYEAVDNDDMDELKSLSHQLKGVAANLRIQDAQEILIKINQADNFSTSIIDLDKFYKIIAKLAGEEIQENETEAISKNIPKIDEDELEIADDIEESADDALEIPEIDEDELEIADNIEESANDALEIPEIDEDALEIADDIEDDSEDTMDISEVDENALQIDDFDLLDEEQDNLIDTQEQTEIQEDDANSNMIKVYDKKSVAEEIGLDEESFNELLEDYSIESQNLVKEIQDAIEVDDPAAWQHAAVKLKGMSDNMRIDAFQTDVEVLINTHDKDDAKSIIKRVEGVLLQILDLKD